MKSSSLIYVCLLALFISFQVSGIKMFYIEKTVTIAPWDYMTILLAMFCLFYISRNKVFVHKDIYVALILIVSFTTWIGLEALRSPDPLRGFSMFLIMVRNVLLFFTASILINQLKDLQLLNKLIYYLGVCFALLTISLYMVKLKSYQEIVLDPSRWHPGIVYFLDQGGVLRLMGLTDDPNFFSMYMMVSLLTGFALVQGKRFLQWMGIGLIGLSLLLAYSRSFLLFFALSCLLLVFLTIFSSILKPGKTSESWSYLKRLWASIGLIAIAGSVWSLFQGSIWQQMLERFTLIERSGRFSLWQQVFAHGLDHFWIGHGLRTIEGVLQGMYSHNSFLDLIIETGFIGLLLWGLFFLFITVRGFQKLHHMDTIPWFHAWLMFPLLMMSFSILYHPMYWLVAGLLMYRERGSDSPESRA